MVQAHTVTPCLQKDSPWQKGPMQLAVHLQKENEHLRGMLFSAQKQAEKAIEEGFNQSSVDYAHLLEIVKEFGDSVNNCSPTVEPSNVAVMSFNTEEFRLDEDDCDEQDL